MFPHSILFIRHQVIGCSIAICRSTLRSEWVWSSKLASIRISPRCPRTFRPVAPFFRMWTRNGTTSFTWTRYKRAPPSPTEMCWIMKCHQTDPWRLKPQRPSLFLLRRTIFSCLIDSLRIPSQCRPFLLPNRADYLVLLTLFCSSSVHYSVQQHYYEMIHHKSL